MTAIIRGGVGIVAGGMMMATLGEPAIAAAVDRAMIGRTEDDFGGKARA